MSEFPALRDALVAAGKRRRRRRRAVGTAVPSLAVAAAVVALVSFPSAPPDREQAAPRPLGPLEQLYGVFRRAQRPEDRLSQGLAREFAIDPAQSRQVGPDSGLFVAPTRDGRSLCTVLAGGGGYGSGCTPLARLRAGTAQGVWMGSTYGLLFRDSVRDVRLLRDDGRRDAPRIVDNGVVARADHQFTGVSWTSGTTRYVNRVARAGAPSAPPSACPALDPLPRDSLERAIRAALLAVDQLYPDAKAARVIGASEGPSGSTPCPRSVMKRSVIVVLAAGAKPRRLLLGMDSGAMRVLHLLD
jgi:hypothetical protein